MVSVCFYSNSYSLTAAKRNFLAAGNLGIMGEKGGVVMAEERGGILHFNLHINP